MSEEILINVTPQGEAEFSAMHLTCIVAAERPHMGEAEYSLMSSGHQHRRTGALCGDLGGKRAGVSIGDNATPRMAGDE